MRGTGILTAALVAALAALHAAPTARAQSPEAGIDLAPEAIAVAPCGTLSTGFEIDAEDARAAAAKALTAGYMLGYVLGYLHGTLEREGTSGPLREDEYLAFGGAYTEACATDPGLSILDAARRAAKALSQ
jgi:hypothetical protein